MNSCVAVGSGLAVPFEVFVVGGVTWLRVRRLHGYACRRVRVCVLPSAVAGCAVDVRGEAVGEAVEDALEVGVVGFGRVGEVEVPHVGAAFAPGGVVAGVLLFDDAGGALEKSQSVRRRSGREQGRILPDIDIARSHEEPPARRKAQIGQDVSEMIPDGPHHSADDRPSSAGGVMETSMICAIATMLHGPAISTLTISHSRSASPQSPSQLRN